MSFSVGSITVNGVAVPVELGETTGVLFDVYQSHVNKIQNALFVTSGGSQAGPPLTPAALSDVQDAITGLRDLVLKGMPVIVGGIPTTHYMTYDMAQRLTMLFQSLDAIGESVSNNTSVPFLFSSTTRAHTWQNLVTVTAFLQSLFNVDRSFNTRSLQAMVELDYVRAGNELINQKMRDLKEALKQTQDVIDNLGALQNLHNQVVIDTPGSFTSVTNFNWSGKKTDTGGGIQTETNAGYMSAYLLAASAYYGRKIAPQFAVPSGSSYILTAAATKLYGLIAAGTATIEFPTNQMPFANIKNLPFLRIPAPMTLDPEIISYYHLETPPVQVDFENEPTNIYYSTDALFYMVGQAIEHTIDAGYVSIQSPGVIVLRPPANDSVSKEIMTWLSAIPTGLDDTKKSLVAYRNALANEIAALSAANGNNPIDPSSLLGKLKQVLNDIQTTFITATGAQVGSTTTLLSAYNGLAGWMLDKYNLRTDALNANQGGIYQQNLNFAITSAQAQNDQQALEVRQFLYVFKQFYQSASATLQSITQIIKEIAGNLG